MQSVIGDLLRWCLDSNWPVAQVLGPFLGSLGAAIEVEVREFLRGDDDCGKYHLISGVGWHMPPNGLAALEADLRRLAEEPTSSEALEEVPEVADEALARLSMGD